MSKLSSLLCALALFGIAHDAARSEDRACRFAEWGYSYYRIEQEGETWTYLLTASGPNWRNIPYGYHGPGYLAYEGAGGLYHFGDRAELQPATAAERAARRKEWVGYPYTPLGPQGLEHHGSREGITLGPLTGYAVLYRFVANEDGQQTSWADRLARAGKGGLLVIHLTDGCA